MEQLFFTPKQLDIALDTAKTMLPMCAGFVVVAGPALRFMWDEQYLKHRWVRILVIASFVLAVCSAGVWSGVFAYGSNAAYAFGREHAVTFDPKVIEYLNTNWNRTILCGKIAHILFTLSVGLFGIVALWLISQPRYANQQPSA